MTNLEESLWNASLRLKKPLYARIILSVWTIAVLSFFIWFAFAEPFSAILFKYLLSNNSPPIIITFLTIPIMFFRAVIVVESIGYIYHRFFQHVGQMTRKAHYIRKNQKFHWIHHMIDYPIGEKYISDTYRKAESGFQWNWAPPFILGIIITFLIIGYNVTAWIFIASFFLYGFIIGKAHSYFHIKNHFLSNNSYFKYIEDIHILHHWDQLTNLSILNPFMDILLGTYRSPKYFPKRPTQLLKESDLNTSDIINWRYLLIEASPSEYAAFISAAKLRPEGLGKTGELLKLLKKINSKDSINLFTRAIHCLRQINNLESKQIIADFD